MSLDAVIAKVQKLRALATSSNANEAAAAAAAADKLIQEHRLSEAEIEASADVPFELPDEDPGPLLQQKSRQMWKWHLGSVISDHYDVAHYRMSKWDGHAFKMIGRPSDVATVRYMHAWLTAEIERLARPLLREMKASFCLGAVLGIRDQLIASKKTATAAASEGAAIVLASRSEQADAKLTELHPDLKQTRARARAPSDGGAFAAGVAAGRRIDLAGGSGRALGSGAKQIGGAQ